KGLSITAIIKDIFSKLLPGGSRKVETSLIEEFIYPKYGPGQLWEIVAGEVREMGGRLIMNKKVESLELDCQVEAAGSAEAGKSVKAVICRDGRTGETERIEADVFISSMPLKDLVLGLENKTAGVSAAPAVPAVPEKVAAIAAGLPYRDFVTVGLLIDRLNLKNLTRIKTLNDIIPDCWIYVQDTGVKLGRIQVFNNWSPYLVGDVDKKVWIGLEYFCAENDSFWNMSDEECAEFAIKELVSMKVIDSREDVLDWHREKVKKAYPAYFDTYRDIPGLIKWLDTIDNLYCIGRNGQHRYNNMDHSMVTAMEAVNGIISGKTGRDNIWNVNTETEYHESK
ncbi:MAG: hypothetical protein HGA22_09345, partial [Clostridiales bacterium]|nr:hypothetical protein [Clostridiales bacterium]